MLRFDPLLKELQSNSVRYKQNTGMSDLLHRIFNLIHRIRSWILDNEFIFLRFEETFFNEKRSHEKGGFAYSNFTIPDETISHWQRLEKVIWRGKKANYFPKFSVSLLISYKWAHKTVRETKIMKSLARFVREVIPNFQFYSKRSLLEI
jgi:hypothetical protein